MLLQHKSKSKITDTGTDFQISSKSTTDTPGVIKLTKSKVDANILPLLNMGKNFVPTPVNINELVTDFKIGIERLAYAMRVTNPLYPRIYSNNGELNNNARSMLREKVISKINTNKWPPPLGKKDIETKIKDLRGALHTEMPNIKKSINPQNITKEQREALQNFRKIKNIMIAETDKTNKLCLVDVDFVNQKMDELATDNDNFKLLDKNKDHTEIARKEAKDLLCDIISDTNIAPSNFKDLLQRHPRTSTMHCFLKDHKPSFPECKVRPVQPVKNSAIENLDILIYKVLSQLLPHLKYRIENTGIVLDKIKNSSPLQPDDFLFSLDICSMYQSLPIDDISLRIIRDKLKEHQDSIDLFGFKIRHIMLCIMFIWEHNYIKINNNTYKQELGLSTRGHSSPAVAEILVDYMYILAIDKTKSDPKDLSLYLDDSYGIWKEGKEKYDNFVNSLNSIWPTVQFESTIQDENKTIIFLDLKIKIENDLTLSHEFYQKPTHSGKFLNFTSHTPMQTKINIVVSESRRILKNCSKKEKAYEYLHKFRTQLLNSDYPIEFINTHITTALENPVPTPKNNNSQSTLDEKQYILKCPYVSEPFTRIIKKHVKKSGINAKVVVSSGTTLKKMSLKPSQKCTCSSCNNGIPCTMRDFVYEATCIKCNKNEEYNGKYIGVSGRPGNKRYEEHSQSVRSKNDRTSIGQHVLQKHKRIRNPKIENIFKFKVLKNCKDTLQAFLAEDHYIKELKPSLNNNFGNGFSY